jgi:hypothetical protein
MAVDVASSVAAVLRLRSDVPTACSAALISSLAALRGCDDPAVTFAGLSRVCVPGFADGCQVELSDGAEPSFRVSVPEPATACPVPPDQMLATPFRVVSLTGDPSYAGVVTLWWTGRSPAESDAVIADLLVKHAVALVGQERAMAAVARAEDRAASLAVEAISGRTVGLATGIVMHQHGLPAQDAEDLLRQSAAMTGTTLHQLAASVLRSGALAAAPPRLRSIQPGRG